MHLVRGLSQNHGINMHLVRGISQNHEINIHLVAHYIFLFLRNYALFVKVTVFVICCQYLSIFSQYWSILVNTYQYEDQYGPKKGSTARALELR